MERHRVEVSFVRELLATHTSERGTTSRLYRSEEDTLYIYWRDEDGAWLETGEPGVGVSPARVAHLRPELAAGFEV